MPWSNVNLVMNSRDLTSGQYNNATYNAKDQNLIQGQIDSISLNEINFPYDIPNVQNGFNFFQLVNVNSPTEVITIAIAPGFYMAPELEAAINLSLSGAPFDSGDLVQVAYDSVSQRFSFYTQSGPWRLQSPYTFPPGWTLTTKRNNIGKDLLSIMGFANVNAGAPEFYPTPLISESQPFANQYAGTSGVAPLAFTQYVDVCSPELCQFQEFEGGSTTNLSRRGYVMCRLYVSNNISIGVDTGSAEGTRPFIINRQYYNARVMRWTAGNSVGNISLQLYDDCGVPLQTTYAPRNYQITFNVYEKGDEKEQVMTADGPVMMKRYGTYRPENAGAWASSTYPMVGR